MNATHLGWCLCATAGLALPALTATGGSEVQGNEVRYDEMGHAALACLGGQASELGASQQRSAGSWTALGPYGGDVSCVKASPTAPQVALAGIAPNGGYGGTLFRSTNGGATWGEVSSLSGTSVHDVEFAGDGTCYLGTMDGVWMSADDGASWSTLALGIGANDQVYEVVVDPTAPLTIWAGVASAMGGQPKNVMRSTNGGILWSDVTPTMPTPLSCTGIALDASGSGVVVATFAGSFGGGGVWVSTDGGASWANRSAGLPANPLKDAVYDGARVLVCGGQNFGSQYVGLYSSNDLGASWTALHDGSWPSLSIRDIELRPGLGTTLLLAAETGGVFRSDDSGASWAFGVGGTSMLAANSVSWHPTEADEVLVGASSLAVWRSEDGGASFTPSSAGIGALNVHSIAGNPLDGGQLALAFQGLNDGGIYTSQDAGVTWTLEPAPSTRWNTVGYAPDGTLYALSDGPSSVAAEGLYRRAAAVWIALGPDQGSYFESELFALLFSHLDDQVILLGGSDFGVAGHEATAWRTTDAGASWTKTFEGTDDYEDVTAIEFVADGSEATLLASFTDTSSASSGGALRSTDGGQTWGTASAGLPTTIRATDLAGVAGNAQEFLLVDDYYSGGGLYRTLDAGLSWLSTGHTGRCSRVVTDPFDPSLVYLGDSSAERVLASTDGGASFVPFGDGLVGAGFVRDLAWSEAAYPHALLLATGTGSYGRGLGCLYPFIYCTSSPNSIGAGAQISHTGTVSLSANGFTLLAAGVPAGTPGIFFYGSTQGDYPLGDGRVCAGGALFRFPPSLASGAGILSWPVDLANPPSAAGQIGVGSTWYFQAWYRDPGGPGGSGHNLSDGLSATFCD